MTLPERAYGVVVPTYVYRCGQGCPDFTEQHSMATAPADTPCPSCSGQARRRIGAPALGAGNSSGMRVQDATRATADRPDVVSSLPASRRRAPVTTNPLHRKLPRP
ncbi:regulatory protein, FmdB family protein [Mycobacteroides abscessus subsp. abscessus]|nr:regulatory protein, FmdB family protein [Mycobacteroides abscessus subsp. abscessus]